MSAALHPATVFFLYLLPVAVLLRLGRKCADSVSGKAFFFFLKYTAILLAHLGVRRLLAPRSDCHLDFARGRPAGESSACVTKTPWRIPTWWRAHQTRASDWFLVECESALLSDNRLRGHIPQTKCLLCSPLRNLGDAPTKRLQHKTHDKFFFFSFDRRSYRAKAFLSGASEFIRKKKILEGSSWFLVNDLVWLERNKRPIKSRVMI